MLSRIRASAIPIARRITHPLGELTAAARRLSRGDRDARVGSAGGFAELAELGATFDRMAAGLQREDELRRALVSDVAHELRTPVTILQASCEELAEILELETDEVSATLGISARHVSMDTPLSEGEESTLMDVLENPNAERTEKNIEHKTTFFSFN